MRELANWIREGLETGVGEDPRLRGIYFVGITPRANVIGIALIGKLGVLKARKLLMKAFHGNTYEPGPAAQQVLDELGITLAHCQKLADMHVQFPAAQIAEQLERRGLDELPAS